MTDYELILERMMSVVTLNFENGPLTLFQVYAPDSSYSDAEINLFYKQLQDRLNLIPKRNKEIILGDFNAKIGHDANVNWPKTTGRSSIGDVNGSGEMLLQFKLSIINTFYKQKKHRLVTWISSDGRPKPDRFIKNIKKLQSI